MTTTMTPPDVEQDAPMVVHRVVGTVSGQRRAWAALTMQSPGQAFANVCIDDDVPPLERRRFVDAVVAAVSGLGAHQVLLVVPTGDLMLLEQVHTHCAVLTVARVEETYLVRADLPVGETDLVRADVGALAARVSSVDDGWCAGALDISIEVGR